MADSVALLRHKIKDMSLAVQDGTMNSVITLATIEVGLFLMCCEQRKFAKFYQTAILVW